MDLPWWCDGLLGAVLLAALLAVIVVVFGLF